MHMKIIKCYDCDHEFHGESEKEVLDKMHPHYIEQHKEVMEKANPEDKKAWMETFSKDWSEAEQIRS